MIACRHRSRRSGITRTTLVLISSQLNSVLNIMLRHRSIVAVSKLNFASIQVHFGMPTYLSGDYISPSLNTPEATGASS